jgi:hypothetical protein
VYIVGETGASIRRGSEYRLWDVRMGNGNSLPLCRGLKFFAHRGINDDLAEPCEPCSEMRGGGASSLSEEARNERGIQEDIWRLRSTTDGGMRGSAEGATLEGPALSLGGGSLINQGWSKKEASHILGSTCAWSNVMARTIRKYTSTMRRQCEERT